MPNKDIVPALFENSPIRRTIYEGTVYYSIVDVVRAITGSADAGNLWTKTKKVVANDGIELVKIIHHLRLISSDGKKYLTDCADEQGILLIIEYLHSPKAAPFRVWISQLASERIEEIENPDKGIDNAIAAYKRQGKSDSWIEARIKGRTIRKEETAVLQSHGITKPKDFAHFTDRTNVAVYGHKAHVEKALRGLGKNQSLRDCSTATELGLLFLHEGACRDGIEKTNAQGRAQIDGVYDIVGGIIANTKRALESAF